MKHRILLAAALIAVTPLAAAAQFTAVITPPKKEQPAVVAQQTPQRADSVQQVKLTNMKEWVDSAASALTAKGPVTDTAAVTTTRTRTPVAASQNHHEVASDKSARLPDTASPLPIIALMGAGMLGAGLFLIRKRA